MTERPRAARRPDPSELVSLAERGRILLAVRLGLALVVAVVALIAPDVVEVPPGGLALAWSGALAIGVLAHVLATRQPRGRAQGIVGATVLLDGVLVAWTIAATGGTQSPLRAVPVLHVAVVTILLSGRSGLKVTAWHSLLWFVALFAEAAAILPVHETASALPGDPEFVTASAIQLAGLWGVVIATAVAASANERELRAQKAGLAELSAMVRDLDASDAASQIPPILVDALCRVFGFARGVVLAAPDGDLLPAAAHGVGMPAAAPGVDAIVTSAWEARRTRLAPSLDPRTDPHLAAALPGARNVLVVPLLAERGRPIGVVALERSGRHAHIERWVVGLVERFASHAALTLHNAWLRDRLERQLDENRELQARLRNHNEELESTVRSRTADLRRSLEDLRVADEQRRLLLAHLVHAEEEERKRIAEDVHDDPVQKMSAATMRIQVLRRSLSDPAQLETLDKALAAVRGSIKSLRQLIFELRPLALDAGLGPALREHLESLDSDVELRIVDETRREPPADLRVVLYRMAVEALANVHKHARAHHVTVRIAERDGGFAVRIDDDGVGFASAGTMRSERGHLGLTSMRERAALAGGRCRIDSRPGSGTTVELWVPGETPASPIAGPIGPEATARPARSPAPAETGRAPARSPAPAGTGRAPARTPARDARRAASLPR